MKISQSRSDLLYALLPGLALLGLLLYADPRGDFPLNDDFQNAESVRGLCAKGELRLSPWALASSAAHIGLGSLTCLLASPTNERLRFLMIALGSLLCGAFYLFLRRLALPRPLSLAGSLLLAFDPLYAAMSASFHLEITALAFQLAGLWCFLESVSLDRGDGPTSGPRADLFLLCSSAFCALGYLTRQTAYLSL
ncbi:MAG: phospholipid carrier-dependent glycosyltransferase, partial [Elusimicrobiota bacterium]